jgi:hypothetical protein
MKLTLYVTPYSLDVHQDVPSPTSYRGGITRRRCEEGLTSVAEALVSILHQCGIEVEAENKK